MLAPVTTEQRLRSHLRNNLVPVAIGLKLELVIAAEVGVELLFGDELKKVRVEPHLSHKVH